MYILKTENINILSGPEISLFFKEIKRYAEVGISIIRVLTSLPSLRAHVGVKVRAYFWTF